MYNKLNIGRNQCSEMASAFFALEAGPNRSYNSRNKEQTVIELMYANAHIYRSSEASVCSRKPPPSHVFEQVALTAAEGRAEYFLDGAAGMDLVLSREEMLPN